MNLNPIEWSQAQELLLKLVQILVPLTEDRSIPISSFLNRRFFIPPSNEEIQGFQFRHPVRLLTNLHNVQKQVEELIGEAPPSTKIPNSPKPIPELRKDCHPMQTTHKADPKPCPPLSKQAQKLINQVQDAIGQLCSSTNIKNPGEAPLRETLKHLKPSLDRMIEAVTQEELFPSKGIPSSCRLPIPRSSREEQIIQKVTPHAEGPLEKTFYEGRGQLEKIESQPKVPTSLTQTFKLQKQDSQWLNQELPVKKEQVPDSNPSEKTKEKIQKKEEETRTDHQAPEIPSSKREAQASDRFSSNTKSHVSNENNAAAPVKKADDVKTTRPIEQTSLPIVPFLPDNRSLSFERKKKKRKGFWYRENEDRNNS